MDIYYFKDDSYEEARVGKKKGKEVAWLCHHRLYSPGLTWKRPPLLVQSCPQWNKFLFIPTPSIYLVFNPLALSSSLHFLILSRALTSFFPNNSIYLKLNPGNFYKEAPFQHYPLVGLLRKMEQGQFLKRTLSQSVQLFLSRYSPVEKAVLRAWCPRRRTYYLAELYLSSF